MNSREATLEGDKVAEELKAIPIPIPKINMPPRIAIVVKLNTEERGLEPLEGVLLGLLLYLRVKSSFLTSRLGQQGVVNKYLPL